MTIECRIADARSHPSAMSSVSRTTVRVEAIEPERGTVLPSQDNPKLSEPGTNESSFSRIVRRGWKPPFQDWLRQSMIEERVITIRKKPYVRLSQTKTWQKLMNSATKSALRREGFESLPVSFDYSAVVSTIQTNKNLIV